MGEVVEFPSNGSTGGGYLAPAPEGAGLGLIVVQEWWGLVDHIRDVTDRFAAEGFVALAPDFFHGAKTTEPDEATRLMMGLAMDRAGRDIAGAASSLASRPETTGNGIGAVGFCMGGSLALWSATLSDDVRAVVGFYPAMPWERMSPSWTRYDGKAVVIHTDAHEGGSQGEGVQQAKTAIEAAGGEVTLYDYPGTGHAFFNDARPEVYAPDAAELAWSRSVEFLRERLGG